MSDLAVAARPRSRWPTGAKLFVTLALALLPLAVIAILATVQLVRVFDMENRARLHIAATESSRALAVELGGDANALRAAAAALAVDPADAPSCARVRGVFAGQGSPASRFAIIGPGRRLLCGDAFAGMMPARATSAVPPITATIRPGDGLILSVRPDGRRGVVASAFFPAAYLGMIGHPGGAGGLAAFGTTLMDGDVQLPLTTLPTADGLDRRETIRTALGVDSLMLVMQVRSAPITWPLVLALLLPVLMLAAAAGISWFVVDRLLIRPLQQLRASVAGYQPGDLIDPGATRGLPAQEIRDLGDTFRAISRTVALHEAGLADGLVRQARLTREVHHRVKNNLQVISSLINIHARGSRSAEASGAYASIQRRVDALAVVHRHHFADTEDSHGLSLRSILGELASNIRATAPATSQQLGIAFDIDPFLVTQDVAVAAAFLITETVELAMAIDPNAQLRITAKPGAAPDRAALVVASPALREGERLRAALAERYGRVMEGLARQLRSPLAHDVETGTYQIAIAILGRD